MSSRRQRKRERRGAISKREYREQQLAARASRLLLSKQRPLEREWRAFNRNAPGEHQTSIEIMCNAIGSFRYSEAWQEIGTVGRWWSAWMQLWRGIDAAHGPFWSVDRTAFYNNVTFETDAALFALGTRIVADANVSTNRAYMVSGLQSWLPYTSNPPQTIVMSPANYQALQQQLVVTNVNQAAGTITVSAIEGDE